MKMKINQGRDFKYQYVYQVESRLDKKWPRRKGKLRQEEQSRALEVQMTVQSEPHSPARVIPLPQSNTDKQLPWQDLHCSYKSNTGKKKVCQQ